MASKTCLPTTAWFLRDEEGRPLGQIRRSRLPEVGAEVGGDGELASAVTVEVEELRPNLLHAPLQGGREDEGVSGAGTR